MAFVTAPSREMEAAHANLLGPGSTVKNVIRTNMAPLANHVNVLLTVSAMMVRNWVKIASEVCDTCQS